MKFLIFCLPLFFFTNIVAQTDIESEVNTFVKEINIVFTAKNESKDSTIKTTEEDWLWKSKESKIKTAEEVSGLNFNGFKLLNQNIEKGQIITTWIDCDDLLILKINKKSHHFIFFSSQKLSGELIKQTAGNVTCPEFVNCK